MRRLVRLTLLGALVGIVGIGTALPAQSLNPQTWTWVVDCRDSDGVNTMETLSLNTTLPSGVYAVTVEGVCLHTGGSRDWNVGTPCSVPVVGTVPCTTVTTINNTPGAVCSLVTGAGLYANACEPVATTTSCFLTVLVNGQCLVSGTAGLVTHDGTGMHAKFWDSNHGDNTGFFVVTAALTALSP